MNNEIDRHWNLSSKWQYFHVMFYVSFTKCTECNGSISQGCCVNHPPASPNLSLSSNPHALSHRAPHVTGRSLQLHPSHTVSLTPLICSLLSTLRRTVKPRDEGGITSPTDQQVLLSITLGATSIGLFKKIVLLSWLCKLFFTSSLQH